jgi:hypothetical protein
MKFSNEHYSMLKNSIANELKAQNVTKSQVDDNYKELSEKRKLWDVYHASMSGVYARSIILPIMNEYQDSHIETAIKKAWSEIN